MFSRQPKFRDRRDAGRQLAAALHYLEASQPVILALPRGGVPVAYEVAQALHAPLDVFLVRKIGAPYFPELGLGAVAEGREAFCVLNEDLVRQSGVTEGYLEAEKQRQIEEMARRRALYRDGRELIDLRGRVVVVVDDGIATGGTMRVALQAIASAQPQQLLYAVPVAPRTTIAALHSIVDDGVCLYSPDDFRAVSQYYADFDQTSDEEVIALLQNAASMQRPAQPEKENAMEPISDIMTSEPGRQSADEVRRPSSDQADGRF